MFDWLQENNFGSVGDFNDIGSVGIFDRLAALSYSFKERHLIGTLKCNNLDVARKK